MAFGQYNGPDKPNKGEENGACNRQRCQAEPAVWFNYGTNKWYCADCRKDIEFDSFNFNEWKIKYYPVMGHLRFETREQINKRLE